MNTLYNFENWILESKEINFSLWLKNLAQKDPSLLDIIDEYIGDKDPTIDLENLLDTLDAQKKKELRRRIEAKIAKDSPAQVTTSTQEINPVKQKTLFKLFIKTLSFFENVEIEKNQRNKNYNNYMRNQRNPHNI